MKLRTRTLQVAAMLLLACLPLSVPATDLKLATVAPEGSSWMKDLRAAGLQIRERTGGRVNIKFYGGGIQGTDKKVLRKIRIGQLQGGVFTSNSLEERYPDILIYGLPMLFNSQDEVDYVRRKMDAKLIEGLDKAGFVSYGFAGGGFAYFMTGKPVAGLADLRGQKIWVPEGDQTSYVAMQALKLSPVVLPITDVLTGLETGLLDIVATPPVGAVILQWYTKTKFVTNLPLSYTLGVLAIDKGALQGVSEADKAAIREVMSALYARLDAQNRGDNAKAEQALRANGLKFVEPNAAEVPEWRAAVSAAMDGMAAKGAFSGELLAEVRRHLQDYRKSRPVARVTGDRP
ncbi:MAG: TRAP transporter substrate-binding protein DctP [Gammaproteobacteria bacterium]|nr:TRAP transporter substrate-binding protein DctP [Gammaproteobacteria bacterium]